MRIKIGDEMYLFDELIVYVFRRPHMRDANLEFELHMGRNHLDNLFDQECVDEKTTELFFSFPERWLNIVEERSLYPRIKRLYPNVKKVTIKTQSVYIIQTTPPECVKIITPQDEDYKPLLQESDTGRLWVPNVLNVVQDASKLTVLHC